MLAVDLKAEELLFSGAELQEVSLGGKRFVVFAATSELPNNTRDTILAGD